MKKISIIIYLLIFICVSSFGQRSVTLDVQSQPATKLLEEIRLQSGLNIYYITEETDSVLVTAKCKNAEPLSLLQSTLVNSPLVLTIFEQNIFVLRNNRLITDFPALTASILYNRQKDASEMASELPTGKVLTASSEYKLYEIGKPGSNKKANISGKVRHFKTGETVAGATIMIDKINLGTSSDQHGKYNLQLEPGFYELRIAGIGIKETKRQIRVNASGQLDIETEEEVFLMDELTILSSKLNRVRETSMGVERFKIKEIKNIPSAFGEVDVLKAVMALPGVKSSGEVSSGFNVRGSSSDQNLILLNQSTIFNPTHLFGLLSVFNPDMVEDMELYMSNIPAKHGGRIASVLDVNGRSGNDKKIGGSASLGLLTSRLNMEGPLSKKTTFNAGARISYSDWLLGFVPDDSGYKDGKAGFYDLNANVRHKVNENNTLTVNGYYSHDNYSFVPTELFSYNNMNISAEWRQVIRPDLNVSYIAGYDKYSNKITDSTSEYDAFDLETAIKLIHAKADFNWYANPNHSLNFGVSTNLTTLQRGSLSPNGDLSLINPENIENERALESAIYISDEWTINSKLAINAGLRYSLYNFLGPRTYYQYNESFLPSVGTLTDTVDFKGLFLKSYHGPEFRFSARYQFNNSLSVKAGFNTMRQNIHKISNATVMSPTDTWKLSDMHIKPQNGIQIAAGIYKNFAKNAFNISTEVYYKTTANYLDYRSGAQLMMNDHIETEVVDTEGQAYGIELSIKKNTGKLNGWISYAYARTLLRQNNPLITNPVNKGDWYPADYDKPHDFKFVGNYKFTHRYSLSCNVFYNTGRPITLPIAKYQFSGGEYIYYSDRNQHRIPDYFRVDAAFNIEPSHHLVLLTHSTLSFGVYNLTGRDNVYSVYYKLKYGKLQGYQLSIFGAAIPYVSYNIKF